MRAWLVASLLVSATAQAEPEPEHAPRTAQVLDEDADGQREADKKTDWLAEKAERSDRKPSDTPDAVAQHPLSLHNMWTDEIWPLQTTTASATAQPDFDRFVRCHFTQASTAMARGLLPLVRLAASHFKSPVVEIVSGYRAPKYQLMLRKKGHEVARESAHPRGEAVDFRLPAIPTKQLLAFVRQQKLGGVGYYPVSAFVHADIGKIRFWKGH